MMVTLRGQLCDWPVFFFLSLSLSTLILLSVRTVGSVTPRKVKHSVPWEPNH